MLQPISILFGAAFTVAVSIALGRMLLRRLALRFFRVEETVIAFVVGSACLSLYTFALCATGFLYRGVVIGSGAVVLLAAWKTGRGRSSGDSFPPLSRFWKWVFGLSFAPFSVLYFVNAMGPEFSPDGTSYHLSLVARYVRDHGFSRITTNMYANLSQGIEMLYVFAFALGRHSAASLVHFAFLVALPLAMLCYARRIGFPGAGVGAAILVYASPIFGMDGTTGYIDVALACVVFALFYLLQVWAESKAPGLLIPIGLLAGFCYAAKYTAFVAVPYVLGFVAWKSLRARKPVLRALAVTCACGALMILPWMGKNWIVLRNPFSPFLNKAFPNPYIHVSFEESYRRELRRYTGLNSYAEIPLEVTVKGAVLGGLLGPGFLLAPLGLLALRFPAGRQLWLGALVFGATYFTNVGTRFLIPAAPFVALAAGIAMAGWSAVLPVLVLAHAVSCWPAVLKRYCSPSAWRLERIPIKQALRIESEESYINFKSPGYGAIRMINRLVPHNAKVITFSQIPEAYSTREILVGYQAASNSVARDILWTPLMAEAAPTGRIRFRFPAQGLADLRLVQTAPANGAPDLWSVNELRVFHGEKELRREPQWRLTAQPNPWDVQLAFDNGPGTRWRSWQALYPGMSISVAFRRITLADSVIVEFSRDQYKVKMKLEGRGESEDWRLLSDAPEEWDAPQPIGLRRAAIEVLKDRGIGYMLIHDDDFGAVEFRLKSMVWGVTQLGEWHGYRLYRFD